MAGTREMTLTEALEALHVMDGALALAAELAGAIGPLIPKPGTLSAEDHAKWEKVVNVIFASADYADKHDLAQWGGKLKGIHLIK